MSTPREYTTDEVRELFLDHVRAMVSFWDKEARRPTTREKLEGFAHSILAMLDGAAADLPGFVVAPRPHKDDKAFCKSEGENWFPEPPDVPCDIGGCLHELFYKRS